MILSAQELDEEGVLILKPLSKEQINKNVFGLVLKNKGWRYKDGDNLEWANPRYDDSDWEKISTTELNLSDSLLQNWSGNIWVRLKFKVDSSLIGKPISFYFRGLGASEIYLDGVKIFEFGKIGTNIKNEQAQYIFKDSFTVSLNDSNTHTFAIRHSNHFFLKLGSKVPSTDVSLGTNFSISYVGKTNTNLNSLDQRFGYIFYLFLATSTLLTFVSFFHLSIYFFVREDATNLWFGLVALSISINLIIVFKSTIIASLTTAFILTTINYIVRVLYYIFILRFLYFCFYPKPPLSWFLLLVLLSINILLIFVLPYQYNPPTIYETMYWFISTPLCLLEIVRILIKAIIKKKKNAFIIGWGFGLFTVLWCFLMLYNLTDIGIKFIHMVVVFIVSQLFLILSMQVFVLRHNRSKEKEVLQLAKDKAEILENQKEKLEEQVQERTEELQTANEEILAINDTLTETLETVEEQRDEILSSIQYAQRIQASILPRDDYFQKLLPEHFILFQPRDVVSGDFYWLAESNSKIVLTAVDCTGHGVPGAFMSMVGNDLLNAIVKDKHISKANEILTQLHKDVRQALQQKETQTNDGMDMALVSIDLKNKILEFAGAKNPLIYIQNGELHQIKGDIMGIGGVQQERERVFTAHEIDISKPTTFYLFSDGYQDQFGGKKGRKFMTKRFRELLFDIHKKPMQEQKSILETTLKDWRGKEEQVDDILVMGVRV